MSDQAITIVFSEPEKRCEGCGCQLILTDCLICHADKKKNRNESNE